MNWFLIALCVLATALADLRWWRVAQREHYLAGSVSRFLTRWTWHSGVVNRLLFVFAVFCLMAGLILPTAIGLLALVVCIAPVGLGIRGRTSPLAFTRRLKTLAGLTIFVQVLALVIAIIVDANAAVFAAGLIAALAPTVVDLATAALGPWERKQSQPFVDSARSRLTSVSPTVVGITGSYGKTTTKNYVSHLLSGSFSVFATPASFNNRAGLSRAINEQLTPGTDIFIAEMGTYGFGEIAELCEFCPPSIAVLTSVGPVHLERFGSEAAIVAAKSEIFARADTCVLNVDDERLALQADALGDQGKKVWRCSATDEQADVCVRSSGDQSDVFIYGELVATEVDLNAPATNVACAVAAALCLEVPAEAVVEKLADLPVVPHRQEVRASDTGPTIIDDTYNANPASGRRALEILANAAPEEARRVLVTPGMVELGRRQPSENYSFAREAAGLATDIVIVGRTNRRALLDGALDAGVQVAVVDRLPKAVEWVKSNTSPGDAVLYVNDLPDHFP